MFFKSDVVCFFNHRVYQFRHLPKYIKFCGKNGTRTRNVVMPL
nr:MAG TPA: hypothetical protein [Caudoviricetes sp.]